MENISFSINDISYLLLIIPGFVVVWSYRFFAKPKPIGEFEYAGLSFIWGVLLVALTAPLVKHLRGYDKLIQNPYAIALVFSTIGFFLGWFGSFVARWKWVKKSVDFLRPENLGK